MTVRVGVVVVAFRSGATIDACVQSILQQPEVCGLVVVDNSPDGDLESSLVADPRLRYIHRPDNPGFARGCNIGAALLTYHTHIAFINPDVTLVRPLTELATIEQQTPYAVIAGGLARTSNGRFGNVRVAATLKRELIKAIAGSRTYVVRDLPVNSNVPVEQLDGALLLLSTDTFARLGGFDARFELYYEDVDLCRAASELGGCVLVTRTFGVHAGGVSSGQAQASAYVASRVSRIRYFRKWSRQGRRVDLGLWLIASTEFLARSLARTTEGPAGRWAGYRAQVRELRHPGTVSCLPRPHTSWTSHA